MQPLGIRPGLSSEDEEVKRKLVKCSLRGYSELIRLNIPGPSSTGSSRPSALRPPQTSVMKPSWEELQARVEFLAKKKRSAKCKAPNALESCHVARVKVPKLGASSLPSAIGEQGSSRQFRVRCQSSHPVAEVS